MHKNVNRKKSVSAGDGEKWEAVTRNQIKFVQHSAQQIRDLSLTLRGNLS